MEGHPDTKTCPECAEEVKAAARVCRFCGYRFDGEQTTPVGALAPPPKTRRRWGVAAALCGLLVLGVAGTSCDAGNRDTQPPPQEPSDSSGAESAAGDQAGIAREFERRMRRQLEGEIAKDARKQVREGVLDGPIERAHCTLSNREPGGARRYACLAITSERGDPAEGYEYQGTANAKNGETTWERGDSPGEGGAPGAQGGR